MSIKQKVVLLIFIAFSITLFLVIGLSTNTVQKIIDEEVYNNYNNRIDNIVRQINASNEELIATGIPDYYEKHIKTKLLDHLKKSYDQTKDTSQKEYSYPFILDSIGRVIMHPTIDSGSKVVSNYEHIKKAISLKNGVFKYKHGATEYWFCFQSFDQWKWFVGYSLPTKVIYKDVPKFRNTLSMIMLVIMISLCIILYFFLYKIFTPLLAITNQMQDIAEGEGDLTKRMNISTSDEIGKVAYWFDKFNVNIHNLVKKVVTNASVVTSATEQLDGLSAQIMNKIQKASDSTAEVTASLKDSSSSITKISDKTETMSQSFTMVVSSIEEISASMKQITKECQNESKMTSAANLQAHKTQNMMNELDKVTHEIEKIVEVINDIAGQTNLLALNAAIEAATAGEAGKGFAVVATEVKELANLSAQATKKIAQQVEHMQKISKKSISEITNVSDFILKIDEISQIITSSIEEQSSVVNTIAGTINVTSTSAEAIAKNVQHTSENLAHITINVENVSGITHGTSHSFGEIKNHIKNLNSYTEDLNKEINKFKI